MFRWNLLYYSLCLLPLVLPLGTTEKSLAPSSLFLPTVTPLSSPKLSFCRQNRPGSQPSSQGRCSSSSPPRPPVSSLQSPYLSRTGSPQAQTLHARRVPPPLGRAWIPPLDLLAVLCLLQPRGLLVYFAMKSLKPY